MYVTGQVAEGPEPDKAQGEPVKLPELSVVKVTIPPGIVGLALISVTVAVHVEGLATATLEGTQFTVVVVMCGEGGVTVNAKVVGVVLAPIGLPVTLTWNEPVGVEKDVETVSTLEPVGVTEDGLNEQEAPAGRPLVQAKLTDCEAPPIKDAVIVSLPEPPCWTLIPPEFDSE